MSDIVERLNKAEPCRENGGVCADTITALRGEVEKWRSAYEKAAQQLKNSAGTVGELVAEKECLRVALEKLSDHFNHGHEWSGLTRGDTILAVERFARAALSPPPVTEEKSDDR
jgi:DNA repair ATPase RecN